MKKIFFIALTAVSIIFFTSTQAISSEIWDFPAPDGQRFNTLVYYPVQDNGQFSRVSAQKSPDILAGTYSSWGTQDGAYVFFIEGSTGDEKWNYFNTDTQGVHELSVVQDENGDGKDDVFVNFTAVGSFESTMRILSGEDGTVIFTFVTHSSIAGHQDPTDLSHPVLTKEDLNGDGHPDLVVRDGFGVIEAHTILE